MATLAAGMALPAVGPRTRLRRHGLEPCSRHLLVPTSPTLGSRVSSGRLYRRAAAEPPALEDQTPPAKPPQPAAGGSLPQTGDWTRALGPVAAVSVIIAAALSTFKILAPQSSESLALVTLSTTFFGTLATVSFAWLQTQFKELKEANEKNKEETREAARKAEEGNQAIMDLIRNEHRASIRDSKLSNYFVVLVSAVVLGVSVLNSLASGSQLR